MLLALTTTTGLAACASPVIYDLEDDKVMVQATSDDAATIHTADEGCGIHGKKALGPLSYRCLDGYCINKVFLFACKAGPNRTQQSLQTIYPSTDNSRRFVPVVDRTTVADRSAFERTLADCRSLADGYAGQPVDEGNVVRDCLSTQGYRILN